MEDLNQIYSYNKKDAKEDYADRGSDLIHRANCIHFGRKYEIKRTLGAMLICVYMCMRLCDYVILP